MMGKQEKRVLTLDRYEHGVVVNALNEMRNDLLLAEGMIAGKSVPWQLERAV